MQHEATASLQAREPESFHLQARETALLHSPRTCLQALSLPPPLSLFLSLSHAHAPAPSLSHLFPKIASIRLITPYTRLSLPPISPCAYSPRINWPAAVRRCTVQLVCDEIAVHPSLLPSLSASHILQKRASQRYLPSP